MLSRSVFDPNTREFVREVVTAHTTSAKASDASRREQNEKEKAAKGRSLVWRLVNCGHFEGKVRPSADLEAPVSTGRLRIFLRDGGWERPAQTSDCKEVNRQASVPSLDCQKF